MAGKTVVNNKFRQVIVMPNRMGLGNFQLARRVKYRELGTTGRRKIAKIKKGKKLWKN